MAQAVPPRVVPGAFIRPGRRVRGLAALWLAFALPAIAGPGGDPFALPEIPDGREAPALPTAYATYPFAPDATFGGPYGTGGLDVIRGGLIGGDAVAMRSATLENGDVVTAGLVTTGGAYTIVLNRQNAGGTGVNWPASGQIYVIHANPGGNRYARIDDLRVFDDRIYVLATRAYSATDTDVDVVVFDLDGNLITRYVGMGTTANERGGGLAFYQVVGTTTVTTYVIVIGEQTAGGRTQPVFSRASWTSAASLVRDPAVGLRPIDIPDGLCGGSSAPCSMRVAGVATTGSSFLAIDPQRIYIGGSILYSGEDWDFAVMRVNRSGDLVESFGIGGIRRVPIDVEGSGTDLATGVAARRQGGSTDAYDEIFLAGNVSQRCDGGIGIVKLADAGGIVSTFGNGGKVVIGGHNGGSGTTPICILNNGDDIASGGIRVAGDYLVVAGQSQWYPFGGGALRGDVLFGAVHANGGAIADFRSYRLISPYTGVREDSIIYGMSVDGSGRVVVAGNTWAGTNGLAFLSGRFIGDRIFGDDLEVD